MNNFFEIFNLVNLNQNLINQIQPIILGLSVLAGLLTTFFLVQAGFEYMTSTGNPEKLLHAKIIIKKSIIGLIIVIASAFLVHFLWQNYNLSSHVTTASVPAIRSLKVQPTKSGIVTIIIDSIIGLLKNIVFSIAQPFIQALIYFTHSTPLMASNQSVLKIWLVIVGIADSLMILMITLLGLHIITSSSLGLEDISLKNMAPVIIFTFILMNSSIFIIDLIINLSNYMVQALYNSFPKLTVWNILNQVAKSSNGLSLVSMLILLIFVILCVILLVYYVMRLVVLYLGAILSPLIFLLSLLPSFRDFVTISIKTYFSTVFVLFVHVIILLLASIILSSLIDNNTKNFNPLMPSIVGIATLITLLKTQKMLMELDFVSVTPKAIRKLSNYVINVMK